VLLKNVKRILNAYLGIMDLTNNKKFKSTAGCRYLTPIILATQEAEIRRIGVQSQSEQIVHKTLS
jgi:hypothetical protein